MLNRAGTKEAKANFTAICLEVPLRYTMYYRIKIERVDVAITEKIL
jgi:hypothetical protein